jgi:hypothetical protein
MEAQTDIVAERRQKAREQARRYYYEKVRPNKPKKERFCVSYTAEYRREYNRFYYERNRLKLLRAAHAYYESKAKLKQQNNDTPQ